MKHSTSLIGKILIVLAFNIGCNQEKFKGSEPAKNITESKNSGLAEERKTSRIKSERNQLTNAILGNYASIEQYKVQYAEANTEQGPKMEIKIMKTEDKTILSQVYIDDQGYGCSGPQTEAEAEIIDVREIEGNYYALTLKKIFCHYTNAIGCEDTEVTENYKTKNQYFKIWLNLKNRNSIIFQSAARKDKCEFAWDFSGLTFKKE